MPSQKDNRNGFAEQNGNEDNWQASEEAQALDIDAVSELSQEEIERLLSQGAGEAQARSRWQPEGENLEQEDVLELLEDTEDDNLQDIQDMLQKSDRNETIDDFSEDDEDSYGEDPVDKLLADIEEAGKEAPVDSKTRKAREKERKAQEKQRMAQEKLRQREEKAARKKAARAEKQEKKDLKKGGAKQAQNEPIAEDANEIKEYDLLLDKDLLDSIVSDAGNLGREKKAQADEAAGGTAPADAQKSSGRTEGDSQVERIESSGKGSENDIMELDMDEVDAFIPDVSEASKEEPKGGKKTGLVSKIVTMLMEEEEPENEDIPISEENQEIIRDLDDEKSSGGKKAKNKAKKPAKKKEKKKKAPKPQKPKKEKKPKEKDTYVPGKKITFRKALPVILLGVTIGAVIFIFVYVASDYSVKRQAAEAYAQGDYQTCYQNLYGKKLTEEEERMYVQAESVLYIRQKLRKYEALLQDGSEVEALDSLIQTVNDYPRLMAYVSQWEVMPEVGQVYASMLSTLSERYGITEEQAREIAAIKSNIVYTRTVTALAGGESYGGFGNAPGQASQDFDSQPEENPNFGEASGNGAEELPDELPEESELEDGNFVDNE